MKTLMTAEARSKSMNGLLNWSRYFFHNGSGLATTTSLNPWIFLRREASVTDRPSWGATLMKERTSWADRPTALSHGRTMISETSLSSELIIASSRVRENWFAVWELSLISSWACRSKLTPVLSYTEYNQVCVAICYFNYAQFTHTTGVIVLIATGSFLLGEKKGRCSST